MTEESMALVELAEKHAGDDFLRELGQYTLQRLMELETEQRVGAGRHERSDRRTNQRNGYRDRSLETRIGRLDLKIPKLRTGSYFPSFLDPRKSSEQALVAVVQEAYVKGISTRKVDDLVQAMGMSGPWASVGRPALFVSKLRYGKRRQRHRAQAEHSGTCPGMGRVHRQASRDCTCEHRGGGRHSRIVVLANSAGARVPGGLHAGGIHGFSSWQK